LSSEKPTLHGRPVDGLTKSKAAIFILPFTADRAADVAYRPTRRLSFTMRHDIFSGSFFESGAKKFATALSDVNVSNASLHVLYRNILVVVDCCFRFGGGGETPWSFELGRFPKLGRSTILGCIARVVLLYNRDVVRQLCCSKFVGEVSLMRSSLAPSLIDANALSRWHVLKTKALPSLHLTLKRCI
jgi:hypothetical protein